MTTDPCRQAIEAAVESATGKHQRKMAKGVADMRSERAKRREERRQ